MALTVRKAKPAVRKAKPDDKGAIAELIYSSGTDVYDYLYGDKALEYLRYEFASGQGLAGYRNVTVAVAEDEEVVGAGCFYGADRYPELIEGSVANMTAFFGEENVMPVLLRSSHAGSVMKPPREGEVYLSNFGVSPSVRSQGVGSQMIQSALARAKAEGFRVFGLDVSTENPRGQALYERLGLKVVDEKSFSDKEAGVSSARKMEMAII
ncbi:GNAT family N-acetyltransferase [Pseudomaricurvus sp.]|uniref:GNAT family N-acetyltransferase n=1 Tax=Pseudomaricurvus sp. TaxID=2004510 RepID=UPI003F6B258E